MSYKHLAGRLIETQRSMLGGPAIDIARSTDGISVTGDGTVTGIEGDGREVVDELAHRYTDMLGDAAESRLLAAAAEFEDELALPPSLGGPGEFADGHRDPAAHDPTGTSSVAEARGPTASDPADGPSTSGVTDGATTSDATEGPTASDPAGDGSTGAVSDGGTVDVGSDGDSSGGPSRVVSPTPSGPGEVASPTSSGPGAGEVVSPTPSGPGEIASPTPGEPERTSYERAVDDESTVTADATVESTTATDVDATPENESDGPTDADSSVPSLSDPVTVRYTVASDLAALDDSELDLASVYLLPDDEAGWQAPVSVEEAVRDAVGDVADVDAAAVDAAVDAVDTERLVATLRGDTGETVSFHLPGPLSGLTLSFHRTGSLAVH